MPPRKRHDDDRQWHLDRRVPITLILTILIQTGGVIYWGATTSERLSVLERKAEVIAPQADRLTRLEVRLENITETLAEIKALLRRP